MATPPVTKTHVEIRTSRRRRAVRWLHARAAWLVADVVAIAACVVVFVRGVG
ncbi:MAG TPA: hypothetical protein VI318_18070 [Baekduia sp.]